MSLRFSTPQCRDMTAPELAAAVQTLLLAAVTGQAAGAGGGETPIPGLHIGAAAKRRPAAGVKRLALGDRPQAQASSSGDAATEAGNAQLQSANNLAALIRQGLRPGACQVSAQANALACLAALPASMSSFPHMQMGAEAAEEVEEAEEAEEEAPKPPRKKKKKTGHRNATAGAGLSKLKGGGGNGAFRLADFTKVQIDGCEVGIDQWTAGDETFGTKDFNPIADKLIREGTKRKGSLASDSVLDNDAIAMSHEIDLYEIVLTGIKELNDAWARHNRDNNPDITLVSVQGVLDALCDGPGIQKIWRHGVRCPLWMREKHTRLKVLYVIKDGQFEVRTFMLLVQGSVCEETIPIAITMMMPEEHPQYKPSSQCKPQSLRSWWSPGLFQVRMIEYCIGKMVVYVFKAPSDLTRTFRKMFESTFPDQLEPSQVEKIAGAGAGGSAVDADAAPQVVLNLDSDDFYDIDIDFDELDAPTMLAADVQKRKEAKFLITEEAVMNARVICTILWPELFKDFLSEAVDKYNSPSPPVWVRALKAADHFKDFFKSAQQLYKDIAAFDAYMKEHVDEWPQFVTFLNSSKDVLAKLSDPSGSSVNTVRLVSAWSAEVAKSLIAFTAADELFQDLHLKFKNPAVRGDLHSTLQQRQSQATNAIGVIVKLIKTLFLSSVSVSAAMPVAHGDKKIELVASATALATQHLSSMCEGFLASNCSIPITTAEGAGTTTLSIRLSEVSTLLGSISEVVTEHYKVWDNALRSEGPPTEDLQVGYNSLCTKFKALESDMKANGKYSWARKGSGMANATALDVMYDKFFSEKDWQSVLIMTHQHQASAVHDRLTTALILLAIPARERLGKTQCSLTTSNFEVAA